MGMRFQKRIQILPWVWLNISKSGFSFSFGPPGLSVNLGKKGARVTAGLPGTGLSASHVFSAHKNHDTPIEQEGEPIHPPLNFDLVPLRDGGDTLYPQAVSFVITTRRASVSAVQRHLKIGYTRASLMVEQMGSDGIVSAMDSEGSRSVVWDGNSELIQPLPVPPKLLRDADGDIYFFKTPLEITNRRLNLALHGTLRAAGNFDSSATTRGDWLLVQSRDRILVQDVDGVIQESYCAGEFEESEVGRLPPGAVAFRVFVFAVRKHFEAPLAVQDKISAILECVCRMQVEEPGAFLGFIEAYDGAAGVVDRLIPKTLDLIPIPDIAITSLKNAGYRTLRDLDRASDSDLLALRGFNKGALAKARSFVSRSDISLDAERIEREPEFRSS